MASIKPPTLRAMTSSLGALGKRALQSQAAQDIKGAIIDVGVRKLGDGALAALSRTGSSTSRAPQSDSAAEKLASLRREASAFPARHPQAMNSPSGKYVLRVHPDAQVHTVLQPAPPYSEAIKQAPYVPSQYGRVPAQSDHRLPHMPSLNNPGQTQPDKPPSYKPLVPPKVSLDAPVLPPKLPHVEVHPDGQLPHMPSWNKQGQASPYKPLPERPPVPAKLPLDAPVLPPKSPHVEVHPDDQLPHMPSWNKQGQALPYRPLPDRPAVPPKMALEASTVPAGQSPARQAATPRPDVRRTPEGTPNNGQGFRASLRSLAKSVFSPSQPTPRNRVMELEGSYGESRLPLKIRLSSADIAAYRRETGNANMDLQNYLAHRQSTPARSADDVRISVDGLHRELRDLDIGEFGFPSASDAMASFAMLAEG